MSNQVTQRLGQDKVSFLTFFLLCTNIYSHVSRIHKWAIPFESTSKDLSSNTWFCIPIIDNFQCSRLYEGLFIYFETDSMYGSRALKYKFWLLFLVNTYLTNMYTYFQLRNILKKSPFKPFHGYTVCTLKTSIFTKVRLVVIKREITY